MCGDGSFVLCKLNEIRAKPSSHLFSGNGDRWVGQVKWRCGIDDEILRGPLMVDRGSADRAASQ